MSPLLPRDKLEEQMPRLFSGINSLYRKHAANQIYTITQVGFRSSYSTRYFSNLPKCAQKIGWNRFLSQKQKFDATLKSVFHCSRIARAGVASKFLPFRSSFQLLLWLSDLSVFCLLLCARTRSEVELHSTFPASPRDWFFRRLKSFASSARAGKAAVMEIGLYLSCPH